MLTNLGRGGGGGGVMAKLLTVGPKNVIFGKSRRQNISKNIS